VYYWVGLSFNNVTNQWTWTDGDTAGNGAVKNANPCEQLVLLCFCFGCASFWLGVRVH
jgi:hypothetical protein